MMKKKSKKIKIEFEDTVIEVPKGWEHITLSDYQRIYMLKPETKLEFIQYVADVCKVDAKVFINAPVQLFEMVANTLDFIFKPDFEPCNKVEIDGKDFSIPFSDKLTLGEWVDVEAVLDSDSETKLSELLAILCRPTGEKYNSELTDERIEVFKNLSCDKVLPLISFFLLKKRKSDEILNRYLVVTTQGEQLLRDTKTFVINGDGIKRFPIWQMIKYYFLIISLKRLLTKCSAFFFTSQIKPKQRRSNIILKNK